MIHARTLNALEFHSIADNLAALCLSGVGRERAQAVAPLEDAEAVTLAARIYEEAADWASAHIHVRPGEFLILFPEDANAPLIGNEAEIKKLVFKSAVNPSSTDCKEHS